MSKVFLINGYKVEINGNAIIRKKVLLFPTGPFLKWQRVTLTLLFSYIIPEKDRCVYNKKFQYNYSNIVFKNKEVEF
ncbi:hypothetical protein F8160_02920 [Bacillus sp. CH126_4D]|nr:hypothetical protein F8162_23330 [Bacillus sp. CH140a_4T]KAB2474616.1 hypothetical protein F8160_02920 [Bacillus sp. CH126_4D]